MSEPPESTKVPRRTAIGAGVGALAGTALAPGFRLIQVARGRTEGEPASSSVRWGMLIDTGRCDSGCTACIDACGKENGFESGIDLRQRPQWIRKIEIKQVRTGRSTTAPMMCQHCAEPPCVDVCPTGASFKRADGIVLVDRHACIGCRYCMMACPYHARSFVHEPVTNQKPDVPRGKGTVESCTFCVHKIDRGGSPACVQACTDDGHHAMVFGDLNDPTSEISQRVKAAASTAVRADLELDPAIRYQGI